MKVETQHTPGPWRYHVGRGSKLKFHIQTEGGFQIASTPDDEQHCDGQAFTNPVTKEPYAIPDNLRHLATRLCRSYGIHGCCDPMYIANVIAFELGLGDGQSHFKEPLTVDAPAA